MKWTRARLLLVPASIAGALVLMSLKCSEAPTTDADGGEDAQPDRLLHPPDHNYDYTDAADVDAGSCSPPPSSDGLVHDWPGYRRLTEIDKCCPLDKLEDLSNAIPYRWVACPGDGGGCLKFDSPTVDETSGARVGGIVVRNAKGLGKYFWLIRQGLLPANDFDQTVYDMASQEPVGAWRTAYTDVCSAVALPSTEEPAVFTQTFGPNGIGHSQGVVVGAGATSSLWAAPPNGAPLGVSWRWTNAAFSNTGRLTLDYQDQAYNILGCQVVGGDGGKCVSANLGSALAHVLVDFAVGDTTFALSENGVSGWAQEYTIGPTGVVTLLRGRTNAHVRTMQTDGVTLVWTETQGSIQIADPQTVTEVWAAPFTTDPGTLAATAKRVATLPIARYPGTAIAFNGYYVVYTAPNYYVVRLSDGALTLLPTRPRPTKRSSYST